LLDLFLLESDKLVAGMDALRPYNPPWEVVNERFSVSAIPGVVLGEGQALMRSDYGLNSIDRLSPGLKAQCARGLRQIVVHGALGPFPHDPFDLP